MRTNRQTAQRLYNFKSAFIHGYLPRADGEDEVLVPKIVVIAILRAEGLDNPCPFRFTERGGVGHMRRWGVE